MQFFGKYWQRWRRRRTDGNAAPIVDHLPTEDIETGFEHSDRFVKAEAVGALLEVLFSKQIISIDDLRVITGDESLEFVSESAQNIATASPAARLE